MQKKIGLFLLSAAVLVGVASCARGPVVPTPPTVQVSQFRSTLFTPDYVKFFGQVVIDNQMRASLDFRKVDYGLSLFDKDLVDKSFADMKRLRSRGRETVSLPIQIPMKDILAQHIAILAEGKMKFTFRGSVYPSDASGFGPIPFSQTIEIPIPNIPKVTFAGTAGVPLTPTFRVQVGIENTNTFPMSINNIDTYLDLNGQRYTMLGTQQSVEIQPGSTGIVELTTQTSKTAALSMALNLAENNAINLKIGGSITAGTPYGYVFIPVEVEGKPSSK